MPLACSPTNRISSIRLAEAKARQGTRTDRLRGKLPPSTVGKTRDRLAAVVGVSGRTLDKARAVVEAAEREPRKFTRLLEQMDRTGNVHGAFKELDRRRQADLIATEPPPLPTGPFRVLVVDPPWRYDLYADDITYRGKGPYPSTWQTSRLDEGRPCRRSFEISFGTD